MATDKLIADQYLFDWHYEQDRQDSLEMKGEAIKFRDNPRNKHLIPFFDKMIEALDLLLTIPLQ